MTLKRHGGIPRQTPRPLNHVRESRDDAITKPDRRQMSIKRSFAPDICCHQRHSQSSEVMFWRDEQPPATTYAIIQQNSRIRYPKAITDQTRQNCYAMRTLPNLFVAKPSIWQQEMKMNLRMLYPFTSDSDGTGTLKLQWNVLKCGPITRAATCTAVEDSKQISKCSGHRYITYAGI